MKLFIAFAAIILLAVSAAQALSPKEERILLQQVGEINGRLQSVERRVEDNGKVGQDTRDRVNELQGSFKTATAIFLGLLGLAVLFIGFAINWLRELSQRIHILLLEQKNTKIIRPNQ